MTITYKTKLAEAKPYQQLERNTYLELLARKKNEIYFGEFGAYLGREIDLGGQKIYFPFIDIDGAPKKSMTLHSMSKKCLQSLSRLNRSYCF